MIQHLFKGLAFVTQLIVEDEDRAPTILSLTKECVSSKIMRV